MVQARGARHSLLTLATVALLSPLAATSASVDHDSVTRSNGAIVARIESLRSVYHLGDPIWLRLTLTNKSTDEIDVPGAPAPYALVDLRVLDSRGRALTHGESRRWFPQGENSIRQAWTLLPGKPVVIRFYDSANHWRRSDWADITSWGYLVSTPGSFTVIAILKSDWFAPGAPAADESNKVRISVTRGPAGRITATVHACAVRNATVTNAVHPDYPGSARALGAASVTVEVTVGSSANLLAARVVKGSGNAVIDEAALRAARESSYEPKFVCEQPVQGTYFFHATFTPR